MTFRLPPRTAPCLAGFHHWGAHVDEATGMQFIDQADGGCQPAWARGTPGGGGG